MNLSEPAPQTPAPPSATPPPPAVSVRGNDLVKDIRDKAEAMRAYAQQAKDHELVWWATELKLDAERRGGRLLTEMAESGEQARDTTVSRIDCE